MRLGLCCIFKNEKIRFRTVTAKTVSTLSAIQRLTKIQTICHHNAIELAKAIAFCSTHGIGSFRVNSQIIPLKTHPQYGYSLELLGPEIKESFLKCRALATQNNIRLTFHPDQFVVLNSPRPIIVQNSIEEVEYQAEIAQWIGADVINIHGGGGYGNKPEALKRLKENVAYLSHEARTRLTLENDDRTYHPQDLLPICQTLKLPLVYDVHHHRCNPDNISIETTTPLALNTWNREPVFHISSPKGGWESTTFRSHADYIQPDDFPHAWKHLPITIEIEAKAKELAVLRLLSEVKVFQSLAQ